MYHNTFITMKSMKKVLTDSTFVILPFGHTAEVGALCFVPETNQLVSGSHDRSVMVWNLNDKKRPIRCSVHLDIVSDVCYSPVAKLISSSSYDQTVKIWSIHRSGLLKSFIAHTKAVRSVNFVYDGTSLLTASNDKTVKEWTVANARFSWSFTGHKNWVLSARYSNDGRTIVTASDDRTVKYIDRLTHRSIHTFVSDGEPRKAIFHPSDAFVATLADKSIKIYDLRTLKQLQVYQHDDVLCLDFHSDGNYLMCALRNGTIKIIDLLEGRIAYKLRSVGGSLTTICNSPRGDYFACGLRNGRIIVWETDFEVICREGETINSKYVDTSDRSMFMSRAGSSISDLQGYENESARMGTDVDDLNSKITSVTEKRTVNKGTKHEDICSKMNSIIEVLNKMRFQIDSIDDRCKMLESSYLNAC